MVRNSRCDVLLVEDDLSLRRLYVRALLGVGVNVNVAESAAEAIDMLGRAEYDVLVLDWFLLGGHGGEVISFLRRAPRAGARRVVVVTSAEPTALEHIDRNIVSAVLFKPIDAGALASYIAGSCRGEQGSE